MLSVDAIVDAIAARPAQTVLLVDYDGSLAPIVAVPDAAVALPEALDALRSLVRSLGRVGVVSGRTVEFLAARVPVPGLTLSGLYGMETLIDGQRGVDARAAGFAGTVAKVADDAERRLPGMIVERKAGLSVTLHWRTAPAREHEVLAAAAELASEAGLAQWRTRFAVELRPPVEIDKGTATTALIAGYEVAAFAGDDVGDLAAFDALRRAADEGRVRRAFRIGVRSEEMPAALPVAVDHLVDGPAGLAALLGLIARAADGSA